MTEEIKKIAAVPDPFDLDNLIVVPEYTAVGEKEISRIKVKRPGDQMWFRTHPEYEICVMLFEYQHDEKIYVITVSMQPYFQGLGRKHLLYPYVTTNGVLGLWPVKLANDSGELHSYPESAHDAARKARKKWIRIESDRDAGQYVSVILKRKKEDPKWPDYDQSKWLKLGFKDRLIDSLDHPVVQELELEYKDADD